MRESTRQQFMAYIEKTAELNHVSANDLVGRQFSVDPSVQQTLIDRMSESSDFLNAINLTPVDEQEGEVLGLGAPGLIASRTDTNGAGKRVSRDPSSLDSMKYKCVQTNYDTRIRYAKIDAWAKFPDFQLRIRNHILRGQALDRMRVGFNGRSVAANTNAQTNPLGQDVNIGWLQHVRDLAPARRLATATYGTAAAADFKSLDALIYNARQELLEPWHRDRTDLVVLVSHDLMQDKLLPIINKADDPPTEQIARDLIMSQKRLGNTAAYQVPFFPTASIFITPLSNLSIYEQDGKRRRQIKDSPEVDAVENFESSNDAYVIEDLGACCLVEGISFVH